MVHQYWTVLGRGLSHRVGAGGASGPSAVSLPVITGIMLLLGCTLWFSQALAGQVSLAWDPPLFTTPTGYKLYYWQGSAEVPQSIDVGNQTTYTLTGLVDGETYTFAVTAYDTTDTESDESNTATVTIPSGPTLVSPPPDATLPGPTVLFEWTAGGTSVAEWWLYVGTSTAANDLFNSGSLGSALSTTVSGLPTDGEAIFVRLWSRIKGTWQVHDFQYTAAPAP